MLIINISTCLFSLLILFLFSRAAEPLGLVDKPNSRKLHNGHVPLIGGISVFITTSVVLATILSMNSTTVALFTSFTLMALTGVLDDRFDLSVRLRIIIQLLSACILVFLVGIQIHSLGNPFGLGEVELGLASGVFTVLAIMAAMNAYNMVDGIDGLLGMLSVVSFAGLAFLAYVSGNSLVFIAAIIMLVALLPYLALNLELIKGCKVFMGDAGSMFIGLVIVWMMVLLLKPGLTLQYGLSVSTSLSSELNVRPVAMLWIIALPLMDMLGVMVRRVVKKQNPFKPDRDHLHHIFLRAGFTAREALFIISASAIFWLSVGLYLEYQQISELLIFLLYLFVFGVYLFCLINAHLVVQVFRKLITGVRY